MPAQAADVIHAAAQAAPGEVEVFSGRELALPQSTWHSTD